ncbi:MAG TPA: hypothetical protein VH619_04240 [Verrucomicrobiae bacterium]|nr:hypothetical protein [Verrucomicrobiae bacterium]
MKKSLLLAGAAFLLAAWNITAQPADGPPPDQGDGPPPGEGQEHRHHRPPPLPIVTVLDANGDGIIDADEIANAPAALKKLDKNGDGQLTPDEYMPPRPEGTNAPSPPVGPDGKRRVPPIVAALDVNGDGIIDASEIANASASLLKLDKNGDGKLEPREYRPHPPGHRGPPPDDGDQSSGPPLQQ